MLTKSRSIKIRQQTVTTFPHALNVIIPSTIVYHSQPLKLNGVKKCNPYVWITITYEHNFQEPECQLI